MGFNEQVRTQQSRASGAVNLLRYGRFCVSVGPWVVLGASLGGPRGVPRGPQRSQGGSGDVPGIPGIFLTRIIP